MIQTLPSTPLPQSHLASFPTWSSVRTQKIGFVFKCATERACVSPFPLIIGSLTLICIFKLELTQSSVCPLLMRKMLPSPHPNVWWVARLSTSMYLHMTRRALMLWLSRLLARVLMKKQLQPPLPRHQESHAPALPAFINPVTKSDSMSNEHLSAARATPFSIASLAWMAPHLRCMEVCCSVLADDGRKLHNQTTWVAGCTPKSASPLQLLFWTALAIASKSATRDVRAIS